MKASTVTTSLFALGLAAVAAGPVAAFPKKPAPVPAEAAQPPAGEQQAQQQSSQGSAAPAKEAPTPAPVPAPAEAKPAPAASAKPAEAPPATPAPKPVETKPTKAAAPKPAAPAKPPEPKPAPQVNTPQPPVQPPVVMPTIDPRPEQARWAVVCGQLSLDCTAWNQFPQLKPFEVGTRIAEKDLARSDRQVSVAGWPYDIVFDKEGRMKGRIVTDILHQLEMARTGRDVVVNPKPGSTRDVAFVNMGGEGAYVALSPQHWAEAVGARIGVPSVTAEIRDAAMLATVNRTRNMSIDGRTSVTLLPLRPAQPPHAALGVEPYQVASGMACISGFAVFTFPAPAGTAKPGQTVSLMITNLLFCDGGPAGMKVMERMPQ